MTLSDIVKNYRNVAPISIRLKGCKSREPFSFNLTESASKTNSINWRHEGTKKSYTKPNGFSKLSRAITWIFRSRWQLISVQETVLAPIITPGY